MTALTRLADPKSKLTATYCTWSEHYEANGQDEDEDKLQFDLNGDGMIDPDEFINIDEGIDGSDNNGDGVADEPAELETAPPYNVQLLAIEIRIRCIEPKSKQIRQITVRHSFPE